MKLQNLITLKIEYDCDSDLLSIIKQYNSLFNCTFNKVREIPKIRDSEINNFQKKLNNIDLLDSWFRTSAFYDARALVEANGTEKHVIFGGRNLFLQRCKLKISKEEFQIKKLVPLSSIGEANCQGNRKFQIIDENLVLFKLNKKQHFKLNLKKVSNQWKKYLQKLVKLQNECQVSISYKLSLTHIFITFDYNAIKSYSYKVKQNRVMALDLNPNSIGWSVVLE